MHAISTPTAATAQPDPDAAAFVAIPAQDLFSITFTDDGDLVLEQHDALGNEQAIIVVRRENINALVSAIVTWRADDAAEIDSPPSAPVDLARDRTAAERQRRCRARKRERDSVTVTPRRAGRLTARFFAAVSSLILTRRGAPTRGAPMRDRNEPGRLMSGRESRFSHWTPAMTAGDLHGRKRR